MKLQTFFLLFLLSSPVLRTQTFEIDKTNFILYMTGITALELGNNYFEDEYIDQISPAEIAELDNDDLPFFDNWISLEYDTDIKKYSDYAIYGTVAASVITVYDDSYFWDNLMILSKILMTQSAVCKWTKTLTRRPRPFLYDKGGEFEESYSRHSFYSSHVSTAFSCAVFAYYYHVDNYGASIPLASLLFGGAAATAGLRVAAAQHFPSDALTGAVAGSLISYLICRAHTTDRIKFNFGLNSINLAYQF